ncbi:MAG: peptide-methionine (S)-S-oxide reductase MsrA [Gammaproteobacteria bacterium]|nr:peptide-methionine (S)-S-oxide reductase MsrA [Gammaproteobacteria bacterium]
MKQLIHIWAGLVVTVALGAAPAWAQQGVVDEREAVFAGGCFWCVEADFDHVPGVLSTTSGYTGGTTAKPTYRDVTAGGTGHREAVLITYDASKVTYEELLGVFWRSIDPLDGGGQFCDRGTSYKSAIFVANASEREVAERTKAAIERDAGLEAPIVTTIEDGGPFYPAEDYHQNYYKKNSVRYKFYRFSCGRDSRIKAVWGEQAHAGIEK